LKGFDYLQRSEMNKWWNEGKEETRSKVLLEDVISRTKLEPVTL